MCQQKKKKLAPFNTLFFSQKIAKRLRQSKLKLQRFNDSFQLLVFYVMSFLWGLDVILREGYLGNVSALIANYPAHPMIFLHKLFFIIQMAYYLHLLPELYFQKVKKEDQQAKIVHAIVGFSFVSLAYFWGFQRVGIVALTLHYFGEFISHVFIMIEIFDREDKLTGLNGLQRVSFGITRFATMILAVTVLFFGLEDSEHSLRGYVALFAVSALQGQLVFRFIRNAFATKRAQKLESLVGSAAAGGGAKKSSEKSKKERKRESDLPEADQPDSPAAPKKEAKKAK